MSSPLNVHLAHYDGPLDLLLDLIRRNQVKITDIPIASITGQYLAYMQQALQLDIELSADFVYMAATLIQIKSRLLLPRDPALAQIEEDEDPRQELVNKLVQHQRFKSAAEMLLQKRLIEEAVWSNPQIKHFASEDDPGLDVGLFDLIKTLQQVVERVKSRPTYDVNQEEVSVPDMIRFLQDRLEGGTPRLSATQLFEQQRSKRALLALFLAILELVKRQAIRLEQSAAFGDIDIQLHQGFGNLEDNGQLAELAEEYT